MLKVQVWDLMTSVRSLGEGRLREVLSGWKTKWGQSGAAVGAVLSGALFGMCEFGVGQGTSL